MGSTLIQVNECVGWQYKSIAIIELIEIIMFIAKIINKIKLK